MEIKKIIPYLGVALLAGTGGALTQYYISDTKLERTLRKTEAYEQKLNESNLEDSLYICGEFVDESRDILGYTSQVVGITGKIVESSEKTIMLCANGVLGIYQDQLDTLKGLENQDELDSPEEDLEKL